MKEKIGEVVLFNLLFIMIVHFCIINGQSLLEDPVSFERKNSIKEKTLDIPEVHFNSGYSAYSNKNFERAKKDFEVASQTDSENLKSMSYYNLGNTLHSQGELEESLLAFRKAIELNPNDLDSKFNYELTKRLLQKSQKEQSQQQQSDEEKKDQQKEESEKQSGQDKQEASNDNNSQQQEPQEQEPEYDSKKPNAEVTLDALKADEENLMKRKLDNAKLKILDKDW